MINNVTTYRGRNIILNNRLIIQKGLSEDTVNEIISYHKKLIDIDFSLINEDDVDMIKEKLYQWHFVNFKLQELWGFERNNNYHKFWHLTACTCPRMDNDDRYPSGYYVHNGDCKLHGIEN